MIRLENTKTAEKLFGKWQEGCVWSAMQGVMGDVYVDAVESPVLGAVVLGDFAFLAGEPDRSLVTWIQEDLGKDFLILVPEHDNWNPAIEEEFGERAKKVTRYAIKKERGIFCRKKLRKAVDGLDQGYRLKRIEEELFEQCMKTEWCRDGVANYPDYAAYRDHGLGMVILKGNEIVACCSSYSGFRDGIEIEVDTREDHRRRGLAYACAAGLILECMDRGWYPSWDAHNRMSVGLSQKLGYHFDREYTAYEIHLELR